MNQNQRALPALVSQGLTLADCFAAFASDDPVDVAAHEVAAASIDRDDSLELERHVVVSVSDRGRWLASWRWVPDADLPRDLLQVGAQVTVTRSENDGRTRIGKITVASDGINPDDREYAVQFDDGEFEEGIAGTRIEPHAGPTKDSLTAAVAADQEPTDLESEIDAIVARLVDSEEHACEAAVPDVAYDAVNLLARLKSLAAKPPCAKPAETRYWFVSGRIPGQDEATGILLDSAADREDALRMFEQEMYEVATRGADVQGVVAAKAGITERYGETIFVDCVLCSSTPMTQL